MPSGTQTLSFCSDILSILAFIFLASRSLESENSKDLIHRGKEDYVFPFFKKAKNSPHPFSSPVFCLGLIGQHWVTWPLLATRKGVHESMEQDFHDWHRTVVLNLGSVLRDSDSVGQGWGLTLVFIKFSKNLGFKKKNVIAFYYSMVPTQVIIFNQTHPRFWTSHLIVLTGIL